MPRRQAQIAADKVVATKAFADDLTVTSALNVGANSDFVIKSTLGSSDDNFTILIGNSSTGEGGSAGNSSIYIGPNAGLDSSGSTFNIGIGKDSLSGAQMVANGNVCVGVSTGIEITEGDNNTVIGQTAGSLLTTGDNNTVIGESAGSLLTTGDSNTMIGKGTNCAATAANQTSLGNGALCDTANQCTIGNSSLSIIRAGTDNVCDLGESDQQFKDLHLAGIANIGSIEIFSTGTSIVIGDATSGNALTDTSANNVIIGNNAGIALDDTCNNNIAIGASTLASSTGTCLKNIAIGINGLTALTTGDGNVAIGASAGDKITTGSQNVYFGESAGNTLTTASNCTMIGYNADGVNSLGNQISIGYNAVCTGANQCTIGDANINKIRPGADNICDLGQAGKQFKDLYLSGDLYVDTVQVVGSQGAAVIDATDAATAITQLNALLARCRAHGLIA